MQPSCAKYGSQRRMKSASARSSGTLPRCACSTRTASRSDAARPSTRPGPRLPRFCFSTRGPAASQPRRKFVAERAHANGRCGCRSPSRDAGAVENFLHAHLEDHVGMRADPRAAGRDVAQQRVEHGARPAGVERIDPDQHAVDPEELLAHLVGERLVEHGRLGVDAEPGSAPRTRGDSGCSAASPRGASSAVTAPTTATLRMHRSSWDLPGPCAIVSTGEHCAALGRGPSDREPAFPRNAETLRSEGGEIKAACLRRPLRTLPASELGELARVRPPHLGPRPLWGEGEERRRERRRGEGAPAARLTAVPP